MEGISFIMCCHNSSSTIQRPINSILRQKTHLPHELIVVDNNCSDDTVDIIKKIYNNLNTDTNLNIVTETKPGLSYARMKGLEVSKYSIISFIDDDNIISEDWADTIAAIFENRPEIGIIGSNNEACFLDDVMKPQWFEMVKGHYACKRQAVETGDVTYNRKYVYGAGMCIRRKILSDIFNNQLPLYLSGRKKNILLSGDDSEICMRAVLAGWKIWFCEDLKLKHIMKRERLRWNYFIKMNQGHFASHIILDIYSQLIDGVKVNNRLDIFNELTRGWLELFMKHKIKDIFSDNSWPSAALSQLVGKTKGYFHYFYKYKKIRSDLIGLSRRIGQSHE